MMNWDSYVCNNWPVLRVWWVGGLVAAVLVAVGVWATREPDWAKPLQICLDNGPCLAEDPVAQHDCAKLILKHAWSFSSPHVGIAGTPSRLAEAYQTILFDSPNADGDFKELLETSSPEGQLYALSGLYWTDRDAFNHALVEFGRRTDTVSVTHGCVTQDADLGEVASAMHKGSFPQVLCGAFSRESMPCDPAERPFSNWLNYCQSCDASRGSSNSCVRYSASERRETVLLGGD